MRRKWKERIREERGAATIVEASFVFPIMFFVLIFLIFIGNSYYLKASIDDIVNRAALEGALRVQDPYFASVNGLSNQDISKVKIAPYRYIFSGSGAKKADGSVSQSASIAEITGAIDAKVKEAIVGSSGLISGMKPKLNTNLSRFNNHFIYSTFIVEVSYQIPMPWKFIWRNDQMLVKLSSRAEEPVDDTPEFIRNADMALDYLEMSGLSDRINSFVEDIKSKFVKVKEFFSSTSGEDGN